MGSTSAHAPEVASPRRDDPEEEARARAEGGCGLQMASEAVAVVSAAVLAGGGAGMLAGIALGAINPYALGLLGVCAGAGATVLSKVYAGTRWPRWQRLLGR